MIGPTLLTPFRPLPWQIDPWRDTGPVILLTGSAGGGKSRLAAEKLHGYCLKYPGATALALRKTRESMNASTILFLAHEVIGHDPRVTHVESKHRFEYANGSLLVYGGMKDDEQREQIRSIGQAGGVDIAWLEEATAFSEADYQEVTARMRGRAAPWRQIILSTNPDAPTHWIYRRLILRGEAQAYYSTAADNRHNPEEYTAKLAGLGGVLGERLAHGRWVSAEGAVYDGYSESLHLIDTERVPAEWRRFRSVDFGLTNPFVCQWWALDGDGRLYLYRELYGTQRLVEDWARDIVRLSAGERIETTVCDHDAEDRATLARHGVPNAPADKRVSVGIQCVTARLRRAKDERPRLFVLRNALVEADPALDAAGLPTCTAQEFPGYAWPKGSDGKPQKEEPLKINDHGMDALRYAVMYADGGKLPASLPSPGDPFAESKGQAAVTMTRTATGIKFLRPEHRKRGGL